MIQPSGGMDGASTYIAGALYDIAGYIPAPTNVVQAWVNNLTGGVTVSQNSWTDSTLTIKAGWYGELANSNLPNSISYSDADRGVNGVQYSGISNEWTFQLKGLDYNYYVAPEGQVDYAIQYSDGWTSYMFTVASGKASVTHTVNSR